MGAEDSQLAAVRFMASGAKSKEEAGKNPEECTSSSTAAEARAKFVAQATGDLFKCAAAKGLA